MNERLTFGRLLNNHIAVALAVAAMMLGLFSGGPGHAAAQQDTVVAVMAQRFGSFADARAFSISADGMITVIDGESGNLIMVKPGGGTERTLNGKGWGELGFDHPDDVDATQTIRIYVADEGNHRIQVFDRNFNFISTLDGEIPNDDGFQFRHPRSVAVSRHNDIFILDGDNARIVKFDASGTIAATSGGFDAGRGRLEAPSRIRMNTHDILGVIDGSDLAFFDLYGNYLARWKNADPIAACAPVASSSRWVLATDSALTIVEPVESEWRLVGPVELRESDGSPLTLRAVRDVALVERSLTILTNHEIIRLNLVSRDVPAVR